LPATETCADFDGLPEKFKQNFQFLLWGNS